MPFYLVTHTLMLEAADEDEAARKGVDQIRSGRQVTVAVKSDEVTVKHIVVAESSCDEQCAMGVKAVGIADPPPPVSAADATPLAWADKKFIFKRMLGDALALISWKG